MAVRHPVELQNGRPRVRARDVERSRRIGEVHTSRTFIRDTFPNFLDEIGYKSVAATHRYYSRYASDHGWIDGETSCPDQRHLAAGNRDVTADRTGVIGRASAAVYRANDP